MTKFIITGYFRTGSAYLMRMLNSHSQVFCMNEIYNPSLYGDKMLQYVHPSQYLETFFADRHETHHGFKIMSEQAHFVPVHTIWDYLKEQRFLVILLTRRNLLNRYLSHMLATKNSAWRNVIYKESVMLDPEAFIQDAKIRMQQEGWLTQWFASNPVIKVTYEELVGSDRYTQILDFLGLSREVPKVSTIRQRTRSQESMIVNYWEFKKAFIGTEFERFFDESETKFL
jgi:hypothetical protein